MAFVYRPLHTLPPPIGTTSPEDAKTLSELPGEKLHFQIESPSVSCDPEVSASAEDVTTSKYDPIVAMLQRELEPTPYGSSSDKPVDPLPTNAKSGDKDNQGAADPVDWETETAWSSDSTDKNQPGFLAGGDESEQTPYSGGARRGGDPDSRWTRETFSVAPHKGGRVGVNRQTASGSGTQNNYLIVGDGTTYSYNLETGGPEADQFFADKRRRSSEKTGAAHRSSEEPPAGASSHGHSSNSGNRITGSTPDTRQEHGQKTKRQQSVGGNTAGNNGTQTAFQGPGYPFGNPPRGQTTNIATASCSATVTGNTATGHSTQINCIIPSLKSLPSISSLGSTQDKTDPSSDGTIAIHGNSCADRASQFNCISADMRFLSLDDL